MGSRFTCMYMLFPRDQGHTAHLRWELNSNPSAVLSLLYYCIWRDQKVQTSGVDTSVTEEESAAGSSIWLTIKR